MKTASLDEVLAEQLRRAPYLLASMLVHVLIGFVLASVMLLQRSEDPVPALLVAAPPPPPAVVEEPPPPPEPVPEPDAPDEPVLHPSTVDAEPGVENLPDSLAPSPWENLLDNPALGLGPGGGPPGGGLPGGKPGHGTPATEEALRDALQWLADHQSGAGCWDADEFMLEDRWPDKPASTGRGNPAVDVGVTGLALLAFLGDGHTLSAGRHAEVVDAAVAWLRSVQRDDGLFGGEVGNPTLYNQSIATLALAEAYRLGGRPPPLKGPVERAVRVLVQARNPYGVWRYALEPNGDGDTSITGWMVFALKSAQEGGIAVDKTCFDGAAAWFEAITDPATGRTGYAFGDGGGGRGSLPSRAAHQLQRFPAERSESLTAVALLCRIFMTDAAGLRSWEDHPEHESLARQAALLRAKPPRWDEESGSLDFYYWYYATYALNQWGGAAWKEWERALGRALLPAQRLEDPRDNFHGSWDPADAWGEDGGRVYSTAICALMLEVYYRYARVLGAAAR